MTIPPVRRATMSSSADRPPKSRSLVGSSNRVRSKRASRMAASATRASCPPESVETRLVRDIGGEGHLREHALTRRASKSPAETAS